MFDTLLPDPAELRSADDAALVAAIENCARAEAAASARRLSAVAELTRRRRFVMVLWPRSCFAVSVGYVSESTVCRYIEHQWDVVAA